MIAAKKLNKFKTRKVISEDGSEKKVVFRMVLKKADYQFGQDKSISTNVVRETDISLH